MQRHHLAMFVFLVQIGYWVWKGSRIILSLGSGSSIDPLDFAGLIPLVVSRLGVGKERKKTERRSRRPFRLTPSFDGGLYGGLIGGTIAGVVIGAAYYFSALGSGFEVPWDVVPLILMYTSLVGTGLGAVIQIVILWFRHLVTERQYPGLFFNDVTGGVLGGAIAGIPLGAFGGLLFGPRSLPFVDPRLVAMVAPIGVFAFVLGVLLYDYEGSPRSIMRPMLLTAVMAPLASLLSVLVFGVLNLESFFLDWPGFPDFEIMALGGALFGTVIGVALGLQIGLTLRLYRFWEGSP